MLSGCVAINIEHRADVPIAAARLQARATQVTVEGVVTVASGSFDDGFALQEANSGIYVTHTTGNPVKLGERVRVSGKIVAPNHQIAIEPVAIESLGAGSLPIPLEVKTGAAGPATEGKLVAVRGKVAGNVVDDQPWGWKIHLDDGSGPLLVFIAAATKINSQGFRAGQSLRVVGFSGRFEKHTELLPRSQSDITTIAN